MITCPWCGTNYAVFQSNCKNCGGQMTPPEKTPFVAPSRPPEESALMPPPPPRPISSNYIWRLIMTDAWGVVGFVFALLGSIFTFVGIILILPIVTAIIGIIFTLLGLLFLCGGGAALYWRYQTAQKTVQVLREGQAAEGQIVTVEQNYFVRVNGRNPWVIIYRFHVNGREYQGRVTTLNTPPPGLRPGKMAYALYLPNTPEHNALYPHP